MNESLGFDRDRKMLSRRPSDRDGRRREIVVRRDEASGGICPSDLTGGATVVVPCVAAAGRGGGAGRDGCGAESVDHNDERFPKVGE